MELWVDRELGRGWRFRWIGSRGGDGALGG